MNLKRLTLAVILVAIITGMAWQLGARVANEALDPVFDSK